MMSGNLINELIAELSVSPIIHLHIFLEKKTLVIRDLKLDRLCRYVCNLTTSNAALSAKKSCIVSRDTEPDDVFIRVLF